MKKYILSALLLIAAALQTAWAQGFRVYKTDGTVAQFSLRTDSIVFYDGIGTDVDFGPFTPVNQCIVGTWLMPDGGQITFHEDGTTDYTDAATYEFMPYQGSIVIYDSSESPVRIFKVHSMKSGRMIVNDLDSKSEKSFFVMTCLQPGEVQTIKVNGVSFQMVAVEGGTFWMGSLTGNNNERPPHEVKVSGFSIGQTEVTQELWNAVMETNPSNFKGDKLPVEKVSWDDCQEFIAKLNQLTGKAFRLPTEAEWEFAARGGNQSQNYTYSGSNSIEDVAWYYGNSGSTTHEVATKEPNELGIYDMSGNVWEWCQDWYGANYYSSSVLDNPTGPTSGTFRILRGGGWNYDKRDCRVSLRNYASPDGSDNSMGFRLAL